MSRDSLIQFVQDNKEINDELLRIANIEKKIEEITRKIQNFDHKIARNNRFTLCMALGWALYNLQLFFCSPITQDGRLSSSYGAIPESFFLYMNIVIAYRFISDAHANKKYKTLVAGQLTQLFSERNAVQKIPDILITNENIISAIEASTSTSVKRPAGIVCLIGKKVITEPCCIQRRVRDRWVTLDGYYERNNLDEWIKKNNIVPQTREKYCDDHYQIMQLPSKHACCVKIHAFMNRLIQEYPTMKEKHDITRSARKVSTIKSQIS